MAGETGVCRTCFSVIKGSNFILLSANPDIIDFSTVEDVLKNFLNKTVSATQHVLKSIRL